MRAALLACALAALSAAAPLQAQSAAAPRQFANVVEAWEGQPLSPSESAVLAEVLGHERRAADRARDQYRHPAETLAFFQVRPGMTVVDYLPASGWYTRIIAPYLGPQGRYIAMGPNLTGETNQYFLNSMGGLSEKFPAAAASWNLGPAAAQLSGFNVDAYPESLDGTVDRVLMFRELHNQFRFGWLHEDLLAVRRMLKPDGLVGLIDHRMNEDAPYSMTDGNKGYMRESDAIALMDAYGFDLVAKSEVNANPKDTKDYARGVWELPPSLAGATDETRPKMLAIGESDRMTLLFRKRD